MDQKRAIKLALQGHNVFLTGNAGTGKTYALNEIIDALKAKGRNVATTASTGIASTHINGSTIHSWAGIGIKEKLAEDDLFKLLHNKFSFARIYYADTLIIDEISMLHDFRFDLVERVCRFIKDRHKVFGGMQVIVSGDFFQLPPVTKGSDQKHYCFDARSWNDLNFKVCYLEKIYRQQDPEFIDLLNSIRKNEVTRDHRKILDGLRNNFENFDIATNLFCKNINVDALNKMALNKINDEAHIRYADTSGIDFKVEILKKNCITPSILELKVGAQVMITANINVRDNIVNGTIGTIVEMGTHEISVEIRSSGRIVPVKRHDWKLTEYDEKTEQDKEVAKFKQFPLKLAWALTIHKSQGATFENINLDLRDVFEINMGYVALSRGTSLEGIYLEGYNPLSIIVDNYVLEKDDEFREISKGLED